MKHSIKISIRKEPSSDAGIVRCRTVSLPERILRRLMGEQHRIMVIVPGASVQSMTIQEMSEEEDSSD